MNYKTKLTQVVSVFMVAALVMGGVFQITNTASADAAPGDVVINEFYSTVPSGSSDPEWVEIRNTTASPIDLTGWVIKDGNSSTDDDITLTETIPANGILVFDHVFGWLNNGGDTISLLDPSSVVISSVAYGTAAGSVAASPADTQSGALISGTWTLATPPTKGAANSTQVITVDTASPANAVYGTSFDVAATADSGLSVSISTSGGCSGTGSGNATITMTSGTTACTVHYNQTGNGAYSAALELTETVLAEKAVLTVTGITAGSKTFNGNTSATLNTTGAVLNGVVTGDTVTADYTAAIGTFDTMDVGTGKTVTVSGITTDANPNNYSLTQPTLTADITEEPSAPTPPSGGGSGGGPAPVAPAPLSNPQEDTFRVPRPNLLVGKPGRVLGAINFANGTLVKTANSGTVYMWMDGKLRPFYRGAILTARGLKVSDTQIMDSDGLTWDKIGRPVGYPDGTLIKGKGPTLYVVSGDSKIAIPSTAVLTKLNLSMNKIIIVSDAELSAYDDGGIAK